jgi:hypothetical protein
LKELNYFRFMAPNGPAGAVPGRPFPRDERTLAQTRPEIG